MVERFNVRLFTLGELSLVNGATTLLNGRDNDVRVGRPYKISSLSLWLGLLQGIPPFLARNIPDPLKLYHALTKLCQIHGLCTELHII